MLKAKILSLLAINLLGLGLVAGGGTMAIFTSSASNTGNTFATGYIRLTQNRDQGDTLVGPMFYTSIADPTGRYPYDTNGNPLAPPGGEAIGGMAPGDSMMRAMDVYNNGANALDAQLTKVKATVNPAGITSGAAFDEFIQKLNVIIRAPDIGNGTVLYSGTLAGLLTGQWITVSHPLLMSANGGATNITFSVTLDPSADNIIQGKTFVFDFSFYAEQFRNNIIGT